MTQESDVKLEEKLTCDLETNIKNLANFHRALESLKTGTVMGYFFPSGTCMSLKFTGALCLMTMKNSVKFERELTC